MKKCSELNKAEKKVVEASRNGVIACFGKEAPTTPEKQAARTISADLVRLLAIGGYHGVPAHEGAVRIRGAFIDGALDLSGHVVPCNLALVDCFLNGDITLRGCKVHSLMLEGAQCRGIIIEDTEVVGSIKLTNGFTAAEEISIVGSVIHGSLECARGTFLGHGSVKGADGTFLGYKYSVRCASSRVDGKIVLRDGFHARGIVRLYGTSVMNDVDCTGGTFGSALAGARERVCLILQNMKVEGTLVIEEGGGPDGKGPKTRLFGGIDLSGARIERIVDEVTAKTSRREYASDTTADCCPTFLKLNGLHFTRFSSNTDISGPARIAFLKLYLEPALAKNNGKIKSKAHEFKPQPWAQMVKVLRDSGLANQAREVAIAYEDTRRLAGHAHYFTHWLYGALVGYGHRPARLVKVMATVWLLCGAVYHAAALDGLFAPSSPAVFQNSAYDECRASNWYGCRALLQEHTAFNPYLYSLDVLLPLVDLQQEKDWVPMIPKAHRHDPAKSSFANLINLHASHVVHWVMWCEVLFGWFSSALLAATLAGLAKRMD